MAIFGKNAPNPPSKSHFSKDLRAASEDGQPWPSSAKSGHLGKNPGKNQPKERSQCLFTSRANLKFRNRKFEAYVPPSGKKVATFGKTRGKPAKGHPEPPSDPGLAKR